MDQQDLESLTDLVHELFQFTHEKEEHAEWWMPEAERKVVPFYKCDQYPCVSWNQFQQGRSL